MNDDIKFNIKRKRPEELYKKLTDYFNSVKISEYAESKSLMNIQEKITKRALDILNLTSTENLILDLGCGPGFVGFYLNEIEYRVVSLDIIYDFLIYYDNKEINPINSDMCFLPFRPNTFDGIVSLSALQWIHKKLHDKESLYLLKNLAVDAYSVLKSNSKLIFQFYPQNDVIMEEIGKTFVKSTKFKGELLIDNPKSPKKRKIYLLLEK